MRELMGHKVNLLNDNLVIEVCDEPGIGNANHEYVIHEKSYMPGCGKTPEIWCDIQFQNGPITKDSDINGISQESLLTIIEDRLIGVQAGPFACRENAIALTKIQEAMMWLQRRTNDRARRGVEGTHEK